MKQTIHKILILFGFIPLISGCVSNYSKIVDSGYRKAAVSDYDGALKDFDSAIAINNNYYIAYLYRARVYNQLGNYQKALENANKLSLLLPENAIYYADRGTFKKALGDTMAALSDFHQALKCKKYSRSGYVCRAYGIFLVQIDSCEKGTVYLQKAIDKKAYDECTTKQMLTDLVDKCGKK